MQHQLSCGMKGTRYGNLDTAYSGYVQIRGGHILNAASALFDFEFLGFCVFVL